VHGPLMRKPSFILDEPIRLLPPLLLLPPPLPLRLPLRLLLPLLLLLLDILLSRGSCKEFHHRCACTPFRIPSSYHSRVLHGYSGIWPAYRTNLLNRLRLVGGVTSYVRNSFSQRVLRMARICTHTLRLRLRPDVSYFQLYHGIEVAA